MEHGSWIATTLVYGAAAVLAVPLARLLGLGAIIGFWLLASSSGAGG